MNKFNTTPSGSIENKKIRRGERKSQHMAAASSMGYNLLGATVFTQPGVVPKAVGVGLALKGAGDYLRAYDMKPVLAHGTREKTRQRFNQLAETWANNDGISLKDRMKRHVGKDLGDFKDKEFKMRFNRMMGGLAMSMAGLEINLSAGSNTERIAGAAMLGVGITENLHNAQKSVERSGEIHKMQQGPPGNQD